MKIFFGSIIVVIILGLGYINYKVSVTDNSVNTTQSEESDYSIDKDNRTIFLETPAIEHLMQHNHEAHNSVYDHGHHITTESNIIVSGYDMWITDMEFELENAPSSILHHVQLVDLDTLSQTCGHEGQPTHLANLGEDTLHTTSIVFDEPYGIFIPAGHRLQLIGMFHNPAPPIGVGGDYYDVFARMAINTEPAHSSDRTQPLEYHILHLDDDSCGDTYTFSVPPNTDNYRKIATGTPESEPGATLFEVPGEIIYSGAHLHGWEGGKYLEILQNGVVIRKYDTVVSERSDMQWETPQGPDSILVEAGDVISLSALYDTSNSEGTVGAMGMAAFYFAPEVEVINDD